jgi:uncharacterized membrane protein SpoIIM required for sporulation
MVPTRWFAERQRCWRRLEELLDATSRRGLRSLTRSELQELGLLYRQIASDLAVLRENVGGSGSVEYLNRLLARAHHTIYSAEHQRATDAIRSFAVSYSSIFRANLVPCLISLALFVGSAALGAAVTSVDPDFKSSILGREMIETIDRHEMWTHSIVAIKPIASSAIMTNNMSVALLCFASGIAAGIGTIYMLLFNGLMVGTIAMACASAGMSLPLWSFVAPHGSLELPAIIIAGGAGLRLAQGVLFPGLQPRRQAVANAGALAVRLVLGCIPMLVVAGVVEAFVSPTDLSIPLKFAVAASLFVLLLACLFWKPAHHATADFAA